MATRKLPSKAKQRAATAAAMRRDLARITGMSGRGVTRAQGRSAGAGKSGEV